MNDMQTVKNFLIRETIPIPLSRLWADPKRQRLSSLCYLEKEGRILMLKRNKEPFRGFWTAPGGKLEPGEDPRQTIIREIREETGFTLINPHLQLINSETGADREYNWLVFIFRADEFNGAIQECNEGTLRWIPQSQLGDLEIPDVDRKLLPLTLDGKQWYFIRLCYNDQHQVAAMEKFPI